MKLRKNWKRFWTLDRHHAEGFTLVELIVVIAILAILGGVAVPAYSGYVKKAERANDEALLAEINTAFVSACMMNGENNFARSDVDAALSAGRFAYTAPFADSFNGFYEGGEFKTFEAIIYNAKTGMFAEATATASNIYNILKTTYGEEIATLMASNLGAMGAETLLTETGSVIGWAEGFKLHENAGDAYWNAVLSYVGLTDSDFEGGFASIPAASRYNAVVMTLADKVGDEEIAGAMLSNSTALYAAQNTSNVTTAALGNWLGTGKTTEDIQSSSSGATLAEAGAIYGLYMAYQGENFDNKNGNVLEVMGAAMSDSTFATWVSGDEGKAELEAYKASMEIVYGATSDSEAKNAILTNGFDDPELIKVLESLMGN